MTEVDCRLVEAELPWGEVEDRSVYPFSLPAIAAFTSVSFDWPVTFLVGENGSGKSTLLEAIAVGAGLNAEGGSRNLQFSVHATHSSLHEKLRLFWRGRPKRAFFLRAESFYDVATAYEDVDREIPELTSLHDRSHGESFLEAAQRHFGAHGLYLLDEPED